MSQQVIIGKQPHVRNYFPSERRQTKVALSRSQPRALQDLSTWMRVSGNEMAKSELMTACLPARCDLQIDLKTFPSQFRLCILVTCTQRDGHLRGKRCLFFWLCLLIGMRCPQTLWLSLWYLLCIFLCQALVFWVRQVILGIMTLPFPSDVHAVQVLAWCWEAGSVVWVGAWQKELGRMGFKEVLGFQEQETKPRVYSVSYPAFNNS